MRFRRRHEVEPAAIGLEVQPGGPQGTYRVAVAHTDPEHPSAAVAHWGPAYNAQYVDMAAQILGVPGGDVDLLAEALKGAARARDEFSGMDGYEVWVEKLTAEGQWEKVA